MSDQNRIAQLERALLLCLPANLGVNQAAVDAAERALERQDHAPGASSAPISQGADEANAALTKNHTFSWMPKS